MATITHEEALKLPYVDRVPDELRIIPLTSFFDHLTSEWQLHFEVESGVLGRIAGGEVTQGYYFAERPAADADLELELGTLVCRYFSLPRAMHALYAIEGDIHHCAAILEKYEILSGLGKGVHTGLLATSELEYLLLLLRSFYDMLHVLVRAITEKVVSPGTPDTRAINQLGDSFSRVALAGQSVRAAEDIESKFRLPQPLANWYAAEAPRLLILRDLRDKIAHRGRTVGGVFDHPAGLAVHAMEEPWHSLVNWQSHPKGLLDHLGSLRLVFSLLVADALAMTTRLAGALQSAITPPEPIGQFRYYLRDGFSHRLVQLDETLRSPWERAGGSKLSNYDRMR